jgi:MoxR-like ATPase
MKLPPIVGKSSKRLYAHLKHMLRTSRTPIALVGPTGSGKTLIGLHLLSWYERTFRVPSYYLQMSPDTNRTVLVGGFRLIEGSLTPVKGVIMRAQDEGGIVFLDEFTHAETDDQASVNSAFNSDRVKIVSIGELVSEAQSSTRYMIAHNPITYAGNHPMPISLRRRLYSVWVDFPPVQEESRIARAIVQRETNKKPLRALVQYLVQIAREIRNEDAPLCAANVANAIMALSTLKKGETTELLPEQTLTEAVYRNLYTKIHGTAPTSTEALDDKSVIALHTLIARVGGEQFRDIVFRAFMGPYLTEKTRATLVALLPQF